MSRSATAVFLILVATAAARCQQRKMDFETYEPKSTLVVPQHPVTRAKFPFIDVHNHQWSMDDQDLSGLIRDMDKLNMAVMNNLSGRGYRSYKGQFGIQDTDYLKRTMENIRSHYPNRFIVFTNVMFPDAGAPGWIDRTLKELETDVRNGASGLKIYKDLGMDFRDVNGKLLAIDDPRLDPIWEKCAGLGIPVLIHSADPEPFWEPMDEHNERWLELKTHPDRRRAPGQDPGWAALIAQQHHIFRAHPRTTFIAAHLGWLGNNLEALGALLDSCPNVNVEFGAVIAEIGREPRAARKFFEKYQDRILFGKDSWVPEEYTTYFRVLETDDEYFPYHKKYHAFWRMYGLALPDEILKKIYYKNALRLFPRIDRNLFPDQGK